jgi:hypothetical protein
VTKPWDAVNGVPVDLIGQPLTPGIAQERGGLTFMEYDNSNNAPDDGTYELDGVTYVARKGEPMPPGAEFSAGELPAQEAADKLEETALRGREDYLDDRARNAAPENKARQAPEKKKAE